MHRVFTVDADPLCEIATSSRNRKYIACCEKSTEPSRLPATAGPENVVKLRRAVLEIRAARVFTVVAGRRRRKQRTDLLGRLDCQTASRVRLPSPGWSPSHRHRTSRGRSPRCRAAGWSTRPRYSTDSVDWIAFYAPLIDPALHPVTRPLFTPYRRSVVPLRGGFRYVQHVRPNRGPHKKAAHKYVSMI